jgi:apolipoprotein N-acyltransferase
MDNSISSPPQQQGPKILGSPFSGVFLASWRLGVKFVRATLPARTGLLPALLGAGLLWLCYFPAACGWLGWVALVPLLALVRLPLSGRRVFLWAWLGGLLFFVPALQWMRVADVRMYATWILLAIYCSLFIPAGILLIRCLDRRTSLPLVVTVPVAWVALEFFRSHVATGFGWYLLGHTQHDFLLVSQIADLGGVYSVSALVAAVNALIFEILARLSWFRTLLALPEEDTETQRHGDTEKYPVSLSVSPRLRVSASSSLALSAAAVLGFLAADLGYGAWRLGQEAFMPGPRLALIQGNVPQSTKNEAWSDSEDAPGAARALWQHYQRLTDLAFASRPELLVWPETSFPDPWVEYAEEATTLPVPTTESTNLARAVARLWPTNILLGLNAYLQREQGRDQRYNSALLLRADGQPAGRYDKVHLVPYGEYVPFRDFLPLMNVFSPYDFDYSVTPGQQMTHFPLGEYLFGVLICYEDTVPCLARQYVQAGDAPPVDFLLNVTNDGWFDGTSEHEEHLAISRFRAIETRRSLARAVNMGISAVIDGSGRVLAPQLIEKIGNQHLWAVPSAGATPLPANRWKEFKKTQGVLLASIPIDHRSSVYTHWGDWLPWSCWLVLALCAAADGWRTMKTDKDPRRQGE